jgi:deazaflavin-dependent oxidoreductase (nitroreductase family)
MAEATPQAIAEALARDRTIDITTTGRRSGRPRRVEIWWHRIDGRHYISGLPGARDWYANLLADPELVVHLKHTATADLPARARPVTDPGERAAVLRALLPGVGREADLEAWQASSPIVEVIFAT